MVIKINPDANPVYQELIDTLFALNCFNNGYKFRIELISETECWYICQTDAGSRRFSNRLTLNSALTQVKRAYGVQAK